MGFRLLSRCKIPLSTYIFRHTTHCHTLRLARPNTADKLLRGLYSVCEWSGRLPRVSSLSLTSHCFYHCLSLQQETAWHTAHLIPHDQTLTHSNDSAKSLMRRSCLWYHCFIIAIHLFVCVLKGSCIGCSCF